MSIYTVHVPADRTGSAADPADGVRFVKDGFAWLALLFPVIWVIWHRMWWALVGYVAVAVVIELVSRTVDETAAVVIGIAFAIWFALNAREILRWTLRRKGYDLVAVVEGDSRDQAERRFFDDWLSDRPVPSREPPPPRTPPRRTFGLAPAQPIGLFPSSDGR